MLRWAHRWQAAKQILLNATRSKAPFASMNILMVATATAASASSPASPAPSSSTPSTSTSSGLTAKEDQECPWCTQMAAGPCADSFVAWRNCSKTIQEEERAQAATSDVQAADSRSKSRAARECMPYFKIMNECVRQPGPNFDYYRQLLPLDDGQPTKEELIKDTQN